MRYDVGIFRNNNYQGRQRKRQTELFFFEGISFDCLKAVDERSNEQCRTKDG